MIPGLKYVKYVGGYDDAYSENFVVGEEYALCPEIDNGVLQWKLKLNCTTYTFSEKEVTQFFADSTAENFQASLAAAMAGLSEVEAGYAQMTREVQAANQLAITSGATAGDGSGEIEPESEKAPAPETSSSTAIGYAKRSAASGLRNKAHALRRNITSLAETVESKRAVIESKIAQQMAIFEARAKEMQKQVELLGEVVEMVNLYLGRDEQIVCLRDGAKAPAGTPITFRQNVLYMDEECAKEETHGIDFAEIKKFDKWLLSKPEHLRQVLPEEKGVVVLQVRRHKKDYGPIKDIGDALAEAAKNEENRKSYWLIRNGQRIHRLWADIFVGPRLIPLETELDHFFIRGHTDGETYIRPGDPEYYEAMEAANEHRRHYLRMLLVLQGLIDRTSIFAPYMEGVARPNLLDQDTWGEQIRFLRDVEGTIEDGKPSYDSWRERVNRDLCAGKRIIGGYFPGYFGDGYSDRDDRSRTHPKRASGPSVDGVYTLMDTMADEKGSYKFLYERDDEVCRKVGFYSTRVEYGKATKRASYHLNDDDKFFLCVDNLTLADIPDMQYYIEDRRHRKSYESMIPVLRRAIKFVREEHAAEQPFRELLQRKLTEISPGRPCTNAELDRLTRWWKFKVQEHRPLVSDDAKAYKMIVSEFKNQRKGNPADVELFKSEALPLISNAIAVWSKGDGEFVVVCPVDGLDFVTEEIWRMQEGVPVRVETHEWVHVDKGAYLAWELLLTTKNWEERAWRMLPQHYLSPIHYPALREWVQSNVLRGEKSVLTVYAKERDVRAVIGSFGRRHSGDDVSLQLSVPEILAHGAKDRTVFDSIGEVQISERSVKWKMTRGGVPKFWYEYMSWHSTFIDHNRYGRSSIKKGGSTQRQVIWEDTALWAKVDELIALSETHNRETDQLREWLRSAEKAALDYVKNLWLTSEREKYLTDGGDPDFWEDHLKTLKEPEYDLEQVDEAISEMIVAEKGVQSIAGVQFSQALRHTGVKLKKPNAEVQTLVKSDWALPPALKSEPEAPEEIDSDESELEEAETEN